MSYEIYSYKELEEKMRHMDEIIAKARRVAMDLMTANKMTSIPTNELTELISYAWAQAHTEQVCLRLEMEVRQRAMRAQGVDNESGKERT